MRAGLTFIVVGMCAACVAHAGARIELRRGQKEVLTASRVKSMVAQFVDEERTGLGQEIATILGGELLDAISDLPGAGVIVAAGEDVDSYAVRLGREYHSAALAIAQEQRAMLVAWGVIEDAGPRVRLESYVTQAPDSTLKIRLQAEWEGRPIRGFGAVVPARAFHFAPRIVARRDLFRRRLVVLGERVVHRQPFRTSPQLGTLAVGTRVTSDTLLGRWWRVRTAQGPGWIEDDPNAVRIPPRYIEGRGESVEIHRSPGGARVGRRQLTGRYAVVDATYTTEGRWLSVMPAHSGVPDANDPASMAPTAPPTAVWIRARGVGAEYSLPFIHFVAGLYRYRLGRFEEAARDFGWALDRSDGEDNATLAAMYQHRGLSRIEGHSDDRRGLEDLDRAVELTPYDSRAHSMRALARIASNGQVEEPTIRDISEALRLDPGDRVARDLVFGMKALLASPSDLDRYGPLGRSLERKEWEVAGLHSTAIAIKDTVRSRP